MKTLIKALLQKTPYRIVRDRGRNRFDAIPRQLEQLKGSGYEPGVIIDGGAHLGTFSLEAKQLWPNAKFTLIEPQKACAEPLRVLCEREGFSLRTQALCNPDEARRGTVQMTRTDTPNTGAHVVDANMSDRCSEVPAVTLDEIFAAGSFDKSDRPLLKLDIQGYELQALRGGVKALTMIEVIIAEVSFFYSPSAADIIFELRKSDFHFFDVASLSGRTRDNRLCQGDLVFARGDSPLLADRSWA